MCLRQYSAPSSVSPEFKVAFDVTEWSECLCPQLDITRSSRDDDDYLLLFVFIACVGGVFSGKPPAKHSARKAKRCIMFHTIFEEIVLCIQTCWKSFILNPKCCHWKSLEGWLDWPWCYGAKINLFHAIIGLLLRCRVSIIASIIRLWFISVTIGLKHVALHRFSVHNTCVLNRT